MTDHSQTDLRAHLSALKSNQQLYHTKLTQLTSTRQQVSQQLQQLQHTYDRKIKQLENKLLSFQQENEVLVKQNLLFQNEIGNFQNRLIEKEKIIALLLQQKREGQFHSGSDKSKSDVNQSAKASQDSRARERERERGSKEEANLNFWGKKKEAFGSENVRLQEVSEFGEKIPEAPKVVPPPPPKKKNISAPVPVAPPVPVQQEPAQPQPSKQPQGSPQFFQNFSQPPEQEQDEQETAPVAAPPKPSSKATPPPPRPKKKSPKQLKRAPVQHFQDQTEEQHSQNSQLLMNYFSNEQAPQVEQNSKKISEIQQTIEDPQTTNQPQSLPGVVSPVYSGYPQNQQEEEPNHYEGQGFDVNQHFATDENTQENNFLSHFSNHNQAPEQPEEEVVVAKAAPKKKATRPKVQQAQIYPTQKAFEAEPSFNSNDFFNQLGTEPSPHLDIEESSIDHIDRDSSVLSNQQHYFAQEPSVASQLFEARPKPVKMTKKKAKRDQIKMVDPSLFA